MLYDNIFWRKHESPRLISEPYIFVYMLRPDMNVINLAKRVAAEKHCRVIYTGVTERLARCGNPFALGVPDGTYRIYAVSGEFLLLAQVTDGMAVTIKSFFEVS